MRVGLTQAAKLAGKDPSTITRAAQTGKLSYHQDADGNRVFDVAELERVFGTLKVPGQGEAASEPPAAPAGDQAAAAIAAAQLEAAEREKQLLREQLRMLERQVEDLRVDRDKWQTQAAGITRLLTDQRPQPPEKRAGFAESIAALFRPRTG